MNGAWQHGSTQGKIAEQQERAIPRCESNYEAVSSPPHRFPPSKPNLFRASIARALASPSSSPAAAIVSDHRHTPATSSRARGATATWLANCACCPTRCQRSHQRSTPPSLLPHPEGPTLFPSRRRISLLALALLSGPVQRRPRSHAVRPHLALLVGLSTDQAAFDSLEPTR